MTPFITISERIHLLKRAYEKRKATKLAMQDLAEEASSADEDGAQFEEIE